MRAVDLKGWLRYKTRKEQLVMHIWLKVVRIIQLEFAKGVILEELTWATMVLIRKGTEEYWGIVLVETMWNVCMEVMISRLKKGGLHESLHGF